MVTLDGINISDLHLQHQKAENPNMQTSFKGHFMNVQLCRGLKYGALVIGMQHRSAFYA